MIAHLSGSLSAVDKTQAVVDVGGVGFSVHMAVSADGMEAMAKQIGQPVHVYTHLAVREDDLSLYGFRSPQDRALWRLLIAVNGVGPKAATTILSALDAASLVQCIMAENVNALKKVPGVGPKTAQRIVLELKEKVRKMAVTQGPMAESPDDRAIAEVVEVLEGFGCAADAAQRVARVSLEKLGARAGFDALLAECLKLLAEK